uniref:Protein THEM6 n=1 Tax=Salmo trutta TaxID=8032 RepID=A0A673ZFM3_SALTR
SREMLLCAWFQPPVSDVLAEQCVAGRVLPHDLDYMGHMNNARYLRECDFARLDEHTHIGLPPWWWGPSTIRYRRSLAFGEAFDLRTSHRGMGRQSFFVEQRFVSQGDGFISAVMLCRQNVLRSNPESILQAALQEKGGSVPDYPEDLQHWISFISASSLRP